MENDRNNRKDFIQDIRYQMNKPVFKEKRGIRIRTPPIHVAGRPTRVSRASRASRGGGPNSGGASPEDRQMTQNLTIQEDYSNTSNNINNDSNNNNNNNNIDNKNEEEKFRDRSNVSGFSKLSQETGLVDGDVSLGERSRQSIINYLDKSLDLIEEIDLKIYQRWIDVQAYNIFLTLIFEINNVLITLLILWDIGYNYTFYIDSINSSSMQSDFQVIFIDSWLVVSVLSLNITLIIWKQASFMYYKFQVPAVSRLPDDIMEMIPPNSPHQTRTKSPSFQRLAISFYKSIRDGINNSRKDTKSELGKDLHIRDSGISTSTNHSSVRSSRAQSRQVDDQDDKDDKKETEMVDVKLTIQEEENQPKIVSINEYVE